ncbi:MAG: hypothetical protein QOG34_1368 [Frankiaceae bacterium]|nr:hypothetical protein [Frankiaceae bacterium]
MPGRRHPWHQRLVGPITQFGIRAKLPRMVMIRWPIPYDPGANDLEIVGRYIAQTIMMERFIDMILLEQGSTPRELKRAKLSHKIEKVCALVERPELALDELIPSSTSSCICCYSTSLTGRDGNCGAGSRVVPTPYPTRTQRGCAAAGRSSSARSRCRARAHRAGTKLADEAIGPTWPRTWS